MKMIRKVLFVFVASVGLMASITEASILNAGQPAQANQRGNQRIYWVYYRVSVHSPWVNYGGYYQQAQAMQAVTYFRYRGYETFYR